MADDIKIAPPPWTLKGTVYLFSFWTPQKRACDTPAMAYSPLERDSPFSAPDGGRHLGGLSMIQIIRYSESPVGPYDELILAPGFHEYTVEDEGGVRRKKKNARVTRIYVSQKHTCWNGRKNWNIPKNLAAFDFTDNKDGSTTVKVFPHDTADDATEASSSRTAFFQATVKPVPYFPSFPLSLSLFDYLGVDSTLVQPPLPEGEGSQGELPGTSRWCAVVPKQWCRRASLSWFDLRQTDAEGKAIEGEEANFWPGMGRWQIGMKMEDATIEFPLGKHWDPPRSLL